MILNFFSNISQKNKVPHTWFCSNITLHEKTAIRLNVSKNCNYLDFFQFSWFLFYMSPTFWLCVFKPLIMLLSKAFILCLHAVKEDVSLKNWRKIWNGSSWRLNYVTRYQPGNRVDWSHTFLWASLIDIIINEVRFIHVSD